MTEKNKKNNNLFSAQMGSQSALNNIEKINRIWVWLSPDEIDKDGNKREGICATLLKNTYLPLFTGQESLVPVMQKEADQIEINTGKKVIIAEFVRVN